MKSSTQSAALPSGPKLTGARLGGICFLVLGSLLFLLLGTSLESKSHVSMVDFKAVYYGTRCLLEQGDPYNGPDLLRVYMAEDKEPQAKKILFGEIITLDVNLPTAFPYLVPFALLPWGSAHLAWITLISASFILAACLMWDLSAGNAPVLTGFLLCVFLIGSELLIEVGNMAGIVVSLCAIAAWCFLRERFVSVGILLLAIGLLAKPHDAGFVWLYFLLAGGVFRKRAWQTLLLAAILGIPALVWVSSVAPHWLHEMHANMVATSAPGTVNDPGPASVDPRAHGAVMINLQTAVSVFSHDPRVYNPATYLLCAPLLLLWTYTALRKRASPMNAQLALASIAALSMLPLYHRQHDTRLLLLVFPAFAMLWAKRGATAWIALVLTALGTVFTSNISLQLLAVYTAGLRASASGLAAKMLTVLLCRPAPIILLAMGIFYLSLYVRSAFNADRAQARTSARENASDVA